MKRLFLSGVACFAIGMATLLSSCSTSGTDSSTTPGSTYSGPRQWTYMVYMGADNNLAVGGLINLNDMEKVGSSAGLAIVVQAEFSKQYAAGMPTSDTYRIYVQNDNNANEVNFPTGTSIGAVDMANPATLTDFITWAATNYPAQHYALVVWDHGAGWKARKLSLPLKGAVTDESAASGGALMSLTDMAKAVANSGVHFDIINFDACLMAMYEVAYEFRGLADYLVFSEQTEPGTGDPYDTILGAVAANPTMNGRTLASTIVDKYNAYYVPNTREETTKSALDMAQLDALDAKIVALAKALASEPATQSVVQAAQANTQNYAYPANHDLYDFCKYLNTNLVSGTAKTLCGDIMTQLGTAIINSKTTGAGMANSYGLAIYLPQASQASAADMAQYAGLKCNLTSRAAASGTWGSYVESLIGGGSLATGTGNFALYLSWKKPDGSACNADLDLYVFEPTSTGGEWFAAWMGQTTPNGFFSQESSQAGTSEEYYVANAQVAKGSYVFLANYYADGSSCTQAVANILVKDPSTFIDSDWHAPFAPKTMDLLGKYPGTGCTTLSCIGGYSDWWNAGQTVRMINDYAFGSSLDMPITGRGTQLIFRYDRGSVLQGIKP